MEIQNNVCAGLDHELDVGTNADSGGWVDLPVQFKRPTFQKGGEDDGDV